MSYPETRCYLLELLPQVRLGLRRYVSNRANRDAGWTCADGYHHALEWIGTAPAIRDEEGFLRSDGRDHGPWPDHSDPRWPATCRAGCQRPFVETDEWQHFVENLWRRTDTGETMTLRDAPPGAMWDAFWHRNRRGPDGRFLMVRCPNGRDWAIDSRASNCTNPDDDVHRCWVRHGEPPGVTVDKAGVTCNAGAGSIQAGDYHGFLRGGVLTAG